MLNLPVRLQLSMNDGSHRSRTYRTVLTARITANRLLRERSAVYASITDNRDGMLYTCGRNQIAWTDGEPLNDGRLAR